MPRNREDETTSNWMKEAQKGYIRVAALIIINKQPAHGYEIMKEIKDKTKGFWKPTAGGVYPILRNLEKAEYIVGEWSTTKNRNIKVYKITETGASILKRTIIKQSELANSMSALFQDVEQPLQAAEDDFGRIPDLQCKRCVQHVGRGEAKMEKARRRTNALRHRRGERDHIVLHFGFDFVDAVNLEVRSLLDGMRRIFRHDSSFGQRFRRGYLDG